MGNVDVENIAFLNGIFSEENKIEVLRKDYSKEVKYISYKVKGTYLYDYNLKNFPFDRQALPMTFAHKNKDANQIILIADTKNLSQAKIDKIYSREWEYIGRRDYSGTFSQYSTFGDPNYTQKSGAKQVDFSIYETQILLKRIFFPYLITLFIPLVLMLLISLMLFFYSTGSI
jgi:hypothetical protein